MVQPFLFTFSERLVRPDRPRLTLHLSPRDCATVTKRGPICSTRIRC